MCLVGIPGVEELDEANPGGVPIVMCGEFVGGSKRDVPGGGSNRAELSNREGSKRGGEDVPVPGEDVRIDSSDWGRPEGESIRCRPAAEGSPDADSRLEESVLMGWEWDMKLGGLCSPGRPCPSE